MTPNSAPVKKKIRIHTLFDVLFAFQDFSFQAAGKGFQFDMFSKGVRLSDANLARIPHEAI